MSRRLSFVFQLVGGLTLLAALWAGLLVLPFPILALAYAAP